MDPIASKESLKRKLSNAAIERGHLAQLKQALERECLSDEQLGLLAEWGLLAGPDEAASDYCRRACAALGASSQAVIDGAQYTALQRSFRRYRIHPWWVPIDRSHQEIHFWMGACTWLHEGEHGAHPSIQINTSSLPQRLGYTEEELLAHEYVHAARAAFEEPLYEEFFAYQMAPKRWRRFMGSLYALAGGPLVLCLICFVLSTSLMALGCTSAGMAASTLASAALLGTAAVYLDRRRRYMRCVRRLQALWGGSQQDCFAWSLSLKDREIAFLAQADVVEAQGFCEAQGCLRWRQLMARIRTACMQDA